MLVASLHQAIADVLPDRLEFYENWLTVPGLREGTIGLAPLSAVLSFLRLEGEAYNRDHGACRRVRRGLDGQQHVRRSSGASFGACRRCCGRAARSGRRGRSCARPIPDPRIKIRLRRGTASVDLRGSLFCETREATAMPLCGFYAAAIARVLQHFSLAADAQVHECRAASRGKGCRLKVEVRGASAGEPAAAA